MRLYYRYRENIQAEAENLGESRTVMTGRLNQAMLQRGEEKGKMGQKARKARGQKGQKAPL